MFFNRLFNKNDMNHFVTCFAVIFLCCGPILASVGAIYYVNYFITDMSDESLLLESKAELSQIESTLEKDLEKYDKDIKRLTGDIDRQLVEYDIDMKTAKKHASDARSQEKLQISPFTYIRQIWDEDAASDINRANEIGSKDIPYRDLVDNINSLRNLESEKREQEKQTGKLERIISNIEQDSISRQESWDFEMSCFPYCYLTCEEYPDKMCKGYSIGWEETSYKPHYKIEGIILLSGVFTTITGVVLLSREID